MATRTIGCRGHAKKPPFPYSGLLETDGDPLTECSAANAFLRLVQKFTQIEEKASESVNVKIGPFCIRVILHLWLLTFMV